MLNVVVLFGGVSCEHDISIITAMQIINNFDKAKYRIYPVYITKVGTWLFSHKFTTISGVLNSQGSAKECFVIPCDNGLYCKGLFNRLNKIVSIDIVFVAMHGRNGEDGIYKAISDISRIKCVCSDILPSSLCLDKCVFKYFAKGVVPDNVLPWVVFREGNNVEKTFDDLAKAKLSYPLILKPATLGSSIGISVCHDKNELSQKLNYCTRFDEKILIEKKLTEYKEYNIAIFRDRSGLQISQIEEPVNKDEILSYSDKYLSGSKSSSAGMSSAKRVFPAKIKAKHKKTIESIATKLYQALRLKGVVRFDFLLDVESDKIYINEVNTIPGSYAHYLFTNFTFSEILDKCIDYEIFANQCKSDKIDYFPSTVLKSTGVSLKK